MIPWAVATAVWDCWLEWTGRETLSQTMRKHPAVTALAGVALVLHLAPKRTRRES